MRIALFATCIGDTMFPQAPQATVTLLERLGHEVVFPEGQVCCGQMHANTGYFEKAAQLIRNHVRTFSPVLDGQWDAIVAPSGSCTGSILQEASSFWWEVRRPGPVQPLTRAQAESAGFACAL